MAGLKKSNSKDVERTIAQIEREDSAQLNSEVVTDEDGYVRNEPLLAGYVDEDSVLHDTFSYREMNGADEEAIAKSECRKNGAKLEAVLCSRCVDEIGTLKKKEFGTKWINVIENMLGADVEYMAFKIREISKGKEVTFKHQCPYCGEKIVTSIYTDDFNIIPFKGEREIPFTLPKPYKDKRGELHTDGVLRLPTVLDEEIVVPAMKKNPSAGKTLLLARLIKFDDGAVVTKDVVRNFTVSNRDYLEEIINDNVFGIDIKMHIECPSCGENIDGVAGESNFF